MLSDILFKEIRSFGSEFSTKLTLVIPVYNQEEVIFDHLMSYIENLSEPVEIIIINDCSGDRSGEEIERFLDFLSASKQVIVYRYFRTLIPLFETRCDDFGIRIAKSPWVIEIQADMKIMQKNYDEILIKLMEKNPELAMISCRGVHSSSDLLDGELLIRGREIGDKIEFRFKRMYYFLARTRRGFINRVCRAPVVQPGGKSTSWANTSDTKNKVDWNEIFPHKPTQNAGFLSHKIHMLPHEFEASVAEVLELHIGKIWKGETVMRGPLVINRRIFVEIGGFSLKAFFQGGDDHELSYRLRKRGFKVAFSPIYFASPPQFGTAYKGRAFHKKLWSQFNAFLRRDNFQRTAFFKSFHTFETSKRKNL